jgi:hypothetical protein
VALSLPPPTQRLTDKEMITEPWYRVMAEISRLRAELDALSRLSRGAGALDVIGGGATATFVGST